MEKTFGELMEVVEKRRSYSVHAILITKKTNNKAKANEKAECSLVCFVFLSYTYLNCLFLSQVHLIAQRIEESLSIMIKYNC